MRSAAGDRGARGSRPWSEKGGEITTLNVHEEALPGERLKPRRIALIASKGTLDMAYPPLILATTAASMGWEAGIFFTFYGLDVIHRKRQRQLSVSAVGNPAMPPPLPPLPVKVPNPRWSFARDDGRSHRDDEGLAEPGTFGASR